MSKRAKALLVIAVTLFLALGGAAIYFFTQYLILRETTGSMANTILQGESVLCGRDEVINRGDIVLIRLAADPNKMYLKRVVGLPGDLIQVTGQRVLVNGKELPEERALTRIEGSPESLLSVVKVEPKPDGAQYRVFYNEYQSPGLDPEIKYGVEAAYSISQYHYFLLGDNRDNSWDSRYWGSVSRTQIIGKALMIVRSKANGNEGRLFKPLE